MLKDLNLGIYKCKIKFRENAFQYWVEHKMKINIISQKFQEE